MGFFFFSFSFFSSSLCLAEGHGCSCHSNRRETLIRVCGQPPPPPRTTGFPGLAHTADDMAKCDHHCPPLPATEATRARRGLSSGAPGPASSTNSAFFPVPPTPPHSPPPVPKPTTTLPSFLPPARTTCDYLLSFPGGRFPQPGLPEHLPSDSGHTPRSEGDRRGHCLQGVSI